MSDGRCGVSSRTPKMKNGGSNDNDIVVIAVPSVEEARVLLLETGLFQVCPGSDNSVTDKENGFQVRLVTISRRNCCPASACLKTGKIERPAP
jgi:ATP-dependent RNA circularization protein (DNA/RNA ligase family)